MAPRDKDKKEHGSEPVCECVPVGLMLQVAALEGDNARNKERWKEMDEKHLPLLDSLRLDRVKVVAVFGFSVFVWAAIGHFISSSVEAKMELQKVDIIRAVKGLPPLVTQP